MDKTTSLKEAVDKFESIYDKKANIYYARWKLVNAKQFKNESTDSLVLRLIVVAKYCGFKAVSAVEHRNESMVQSFVSGLEDSYI